jgi:hypothetical protein
MVGVVLPRDLTAGDRFHATVVRDAGSFSSVPGLRVLEVVVPLADGDSGRPTLEGLLVECGPGTPQPAARPLSCTAPSGASEARFVFSRAPGGSPVGRASAPLEPRAAPVVSAFSAPPICVAGAVQIVEGPFEGGDGSLEVSGRAASLIAASPRALYWGLPAGTPLGENRVVVRTGGRPFAIPIWVVRLSLTADRISLEAGETTAFHAVLSGLSAIPDAVWQRGLASRLVDPARVDQLFPDLPVSEAAAKAGVILLAIENASAEAISLENSVGGRIVLSVSASEVTDGVFRYDGRIRSRRAGSFAVSAAVLPLLREVPGRELSSESPARDAATPIARP